MLDIVTNYHCIQLQGKLMIQTQENGIKIGGGLILQKIQAANFFFKILALSVTRYHGQLSSWTISEKTNDRILRKICEGRTDGQTDRRTDGQTDRRTDESDFIRRCPTNVDRPID